MERTRDLLVEQNIEHRVVDVWIKSDSKLADISRALICIENVVELFAVIGRRIHDLTALKVEANIVKYRSLIECWRIKMDNAVDRFPDGSGKAFAIGDISFTGAWDDGDVPDAEFQIGVLVR